MPVSCAYTGAGQGTAGGVGEAELLALPMVTSLRAELAQAQAELGKWQLLLKVSGRAG